MTGTTTSTTPARVLEAKELPRLLEALAAAGYQVVGPTVRDQAVVFSPIDTVAQLPRGTTTSQSPGRYRAEESEHRASNWFSDGPASTGLRPWLHAPVQTLVTLRRKETTVIEPSYPAPPGKPLAFLGARACDLAAVAVQDHVLRERDANYAARRDGALFIAVSCRKAVDSCFCASMGTGPRVTQGFDLCLTEVDDTRFVVEAGTERGQELLQQLPTQRATPEEAAAPDRIAQSVAQSLVRQLDTHRLPERLREQPEHPRFDDVADRCLACTNCTLVCPTCFCSTVEDQPSLDENEVARVRRWDSCFSPTFSYMHGGTVRGSTRSRYRQWITHKLATWHDQFGESGCIGCGRCITWCPVGIDITEEANAFESPEPSPGESAPS